MFAIGLELIAPAGQYFVSVGLVSDVPDEFVVRGIEDVVNGDGQFDDAETGPEVSRVVGQRFDDKMA